MDTNYFVCTLGEAALPDVSRPYRNVNDLIDQQATCSPDRPAVGFYTPEVEDSFKSHIITFKEVLQGVCAVADAIEDNITIPERQTVGLLCNSSPAFLFTWLGLIRLGHPVLLIAPQCSASAIVHLSKACSASALFHDEAHKKLAEMAIAQSAGLDLTDMKAHSFPLEQDEEIFKAVRNGSSPCRRPLTVSETDVAYLHHTSGTSSGIPKPIAQTHKGGVGVLPSLSGSTAATFTTTPLYHGGVADLFRAWCSQAMIWLFPAQHAPITASNIVKCLNASVVSAQNEKSPPVKYFSSVPYVLQMMADDQHGLKYLQGMDLVGVGGAALPPEVGNSLAENDVNLVSRYGSAECGFLMSSHREYSKDKDWQWLRQSDQVKHLQFEKQDNGLFELVILADWPHMAKTNRDDGSFATSDLFAAHPTRPATWMYHSRADSQLTLVTGKKFDPSPMEGSLAASSKLLSEVMIFGNGKPYPGALLFRSENAKDSSDAELVQHITPLVEKLNRESQSHARIPRNMLIPMQYDIAPLEKSSKGTILRSSAETKFKQHMESAYSQTTFDDKNIADKDLPDAISKIIANVVGDNPADGDELTHHTNLFDYGVDSVACIQIRHALSQLLPEDSQPLPLTVVEDSGTISNLSDTILRHKNGEQVEKESSSDFIRGLVDQYSRFEDIEAPTSDARKDRTAYNVLLTGPTGLLGAHILSQLCSQPRVEKIYLLVRGATPHAAKERVLKSLKSRKLPIPATFEAKVQIFPCKLPELRLGLVDKDYKLLTKEVDVIFHLAWSVNFLVSLRSLASIHLAGLQNLLTFALASARRPSFLFCSSVASVSSLQGKQQVPESVVDDVDACGPTGYAQSKLAAELICQRFATTTTTTQSQTHITIVRVGQLSGDTSQGVWNMTEAYPLMLASSKSTGVVPDLPHETLGWLPVDVAARCYIEAAFPLSPRQQQQQQQQHQPSGSVGDRLRVIHLLNTFKATTFNDLVRCLKAVDPKLETVSADEWLESLRGLQRHEDATNHPYLKLLPFWERAYGSNIAPASQDREGGSGGVVADGHGPELNGVCGENGYETRSSIAAMPSLEAAIGPLSDEYLVKVWRWIKEQAN